MPSIEYIVVDYDHLKCHKCGNTINFKEFSLWEGQQDLTLNDFDWGLWEGLDTDHYTLGVVCMECGMIVQAAPGFTVG